MSLKNTARKTSRGRGGKHPPCGLGLRRVALQRVDFQGALKVLFTTIYKGRRY